MKPQTYLEQCGYSIIEYDQDVYPYAVFSHTKKEGGRFWTLDSAVQCLRHWGRIL